MKLEKDRTVQITLTEEEALVLFEWLHRVDESDAGLFACKAERQAMWNTIAALEKVLPLFGGGYQKRVEAAIKSLTWEE